MILTYFARQAAWRRVFIAVLLCGTNSLGASDVEVEASDSEVCKFLGNVAYIVMIKRQQGASMGEVLLMLDDPLYSDMDNILLHYAEEAFKEPIVSGFLGIDAAKAFDDRMTLECMKVRKS